MSGGNKLNNSNANPTKKLGGGLKKLAPPPGFKGKPKANDMLVGGANNSA